MKLGPFKIGESGYFGAGAFGVYERVTKGPEKGYLALAHAPNVGYLTAQEAGALALALEHSSTYGEAFALFNQLRRNMLWSQL